MTSESYAERNSGRHLRIAATCLIVYGIYRLAVAIWLVFFANTATVMFGALLNRVPDPFTMMSVFHIIYTCVIGLSVACGVIGILAGLALLSGQRSGRTLAMIAAFLCLSGIPFGVAVGVYCLVVLLQAPAAATAANISESERLRQFRRQPSTT